MLGSRRSYGRRPPSLTTSCGSPNHIPTLARISAQAGSKLRGQPYTRNLWPFVALGCKTPNAVVSTKSGLFGFICRSRWASTPLEARVRAAFGKVLAEQPTIGAIVRILEFHGFEAIPLTAGPISKVERRDGVSRGRDQPSIYILSREVFRS